MDTLPFELVFSIATHLDSPQDLVSFSRVSSLFLSVARDDRIWKKLCYQLYNIRPPLSQMTRSFYDLFTKILVPYGRYLGYWKSNQRYFGGLIDVHLNITDGIIIAEDMDVVNGAARATQFFGGGDDDDANEDDADESDEEDDRLLKPVYKRTKLFTIDSACHQIFCHTCDMPHDELPWINTFVSNRQYIGLSQEVMPVNKRSLLISHDHQFDKTPEEGDIYFIRHCSDSTSIVYHPISIPEATTGSNDHPLSRLNGFWVGSYGGHGLEVLHLEFCLQFTCPTIADDGEGHEEVVTNALVARKISGDPNVPHGKITFAAIRHIEAQEDSPECYEGIGQIAHTGYVDSQYIRTRVVLVSEHLLKVTWFALHHTSLYKRCQF